MAFDISTLEQFFCSPAFTTSIGGFLGSRATELDFTKALTEEQPLKCALVVGSGRMPFCMPVTPEVGPR